MIGLEFEKTSIMCTVDSRGIPHDCGYGCKDPPKFGLEDHSMEYCHGGCKIPFSNPNATYYDPFVEFEMDPVTGESLGFRGYSNQPFPVCARTCSEWDGADADLKASLSEKERAGFEMYCAGENTDLTAKYMKGRKSAAENKASRAPKGAFYWWGGRKQYFPNVRYQASALAYAQTSYFISIIVVQ